MLSALIVPPGFSVRLDYEPDKPEVMNVSVTVSQGKTWLGVIVSSARTIEEPGSLQAIVDDLTGRGVRLTQEKRK